MSAGLDVEAARKVLLDSLPPNNPKWRIWVDGVLERLEPCVIEDAPPVIDRDALISILSGIASETAATLAADRILALMRPVEGVTLTSEEAALARRALLWSAERQPLSLDHAARQRALAARLEAALAPRSTDKKVI